MVLATRFVNRTSDEIDLPHIEHAVRIKWPKTMICLPVQIFEGKGVLDLSLPVWRHVCLVRLFEGISWRGYEPAHVDCSVRVVTVNYGETLLGTSSGLCALKGNISPEIGS